MRVDASRCRPPTPDGAAQSSEQRPLSTEAGEGADNVRTRTPRRVDPTRGAPKRLLSDGLPMFVCRRCGRTVGRLGDEWDEHLADDKWG